MNNGFLIAEVIFRHVFCRKTAKNGVMIVLLMRQHNLSYFQLFNSLFTDFCVFKALKLFQNFHFSRRGLCL